MQKSIAVYYDAEKNNAPEIIAKGEGLLAQKIMAIAKEYKIPLYHDAILTELLYKMDIGYEIPEYLYEIIAEIYAFTYQILKKE